jgi:hypothetical protein
MRLSGRIAVDIEARREFGIARLERRMQYVPGHDRIIALSPEANRNVARGVAGGRRDADVVVKRIVVGRQFGLPG